jgi:hypothetical protein
LCQTELARQPAASGLPWAGSDEILSSRGRSPSSEPRRFAPSDVCATERRQGGGDGLGEARGDLLTWVSRHGNFSRPSTISSTERSRTDQHGATLGNSKVGRLRLHSCTDQHEPARIDTGQHVMHVSFNPAGRVRDPGGPLAKQQVRLRFRNTGATPRP